MLIQEQYRVCYEAILAAGLSPATLAADPECIKRVVEAARVKLSHDKSVHHGGRCQRCFDVDKELEAALAAIGKEQA